MEEMGVKTHENYEFLRTRDLAAVSREVMNVFVRGGESTSDVEADRS